MSPYDALAELAATVRASREKSPRAQSPFDALIEIGAAVVDRLKAEENYIAADKPNGAIPEAIVDARELCDRAIEFNISVFRTAMKNALVRRI